MFLFLLEISSCDLIHAPRQKLNHYLFLSQKELTILEDINVYQIFNRCHKLKNFLTVQSRFIIIYKFTDFLTTAFTLTE